MQIVGLEKNSVVDFPEKIAAVVFTPGCNLDCYYCHNRFLLAPQTWPELLSEGDVFRFLDKRKNLLDGVVISGGEPTLQKDLKKFMSAVKKMGYSVKLDTNGTNPAVLKELFANQLVDYVAMDFKGPLPKYKQICGDDSHLERIQESIELLLWGQVPYEFRTTFVPELTAEDILEMAKVIQGARFYVLQQYRIPELPNDEKKALRLQKQPHSPNYIRQTAQQVAEWVEVCETRGI
ncbi:MAG: anaerobic ribonucleoside-triphosphate reductase activating protein [Clostridia bacterium]|nr:anaerobic ribonucleoside-triphosphate reductase activating protein [Clostridia bacterium]